MRRIVDGVSVDGGNKTRALVLALLALACGHMLSTLLRTIPAISLDVMAADFATTPQTLAGLTSIYHFSFAASQIPVGAAMDRFGVRPVSLSLLVGTVVGAMASGLATGPESFLFGQFLLGVATSGMLMCPMTLAAKQLSPARFGLWSGAILSIVQCDLYGAPLVPVISVGDALGGATVTRLLFSSQSLNDNGDLAFYAELSNGNAGIFLASEVPGPAPAALLIGAAAALSGRRRRTFRSPLIDRPAAS